MGENGADTPSAARPAFQRFALADPAAFCFLEDDPSTTVLQRQRRLTGFEVYAVEQWICSRTHPTFVIVTYSGRQEHSIVVNVLSVPSDESEWSPRLHTYMRAASKYNARRRETPMGIVMVTNLSSFPSALNIVHIPDGDLRAHRQDFLVNENLKRLACSRRSGLVLAPPSSATQQRFWETYRTCRDIPFATAVLELVKLCQTALLIFGKLAVEYADGLLCDVTEQALNDWWAEIGVEHFNSEPTDGVLGPSTVSALLGLLMGARKRLNSYGSPVSKDVFDLEITKKAIGHFQKSQRLVRTRRLDRLTFQRLHSVTAKTAAGDIWPVPRAVPRAVRSTMAELSGKGDALISGNERGAIAALEALDLDEFIQLGSGARFQWLWQGKPLDKDTRDEPNDRSGEQQPLGNERLQSIGKNRDQMPHEDGLGHRPGLRQRTLSASISSITSKTPPRHQRQPSSVDDAGSNLDLRKSVSQATADRLMDGGRSSLGKIRGLMTRKGHDRGLSAASNSYPENDESNEHNSGGASGDDCQRPSSDFHHSQHDSGSGLDSTLSTHTESYRESSSNDARLGKALSKQQNSSTHAAKANGIAVSDHARTSGSPDAENESPTDSLEEHLGFRNSDAFDDQLPQESIQRYVEILARLRRARSFTSNAPRKSSSWDLYAPRRMSDSAMVYIERSPVASDASYATTPSDTGILFLTEENRVADLGRMQDQLHMIQNSELTWATSKLEELDHFVESCDDRQRKMQDLQQAKNREMHDLQMRDDKTFHAEKSKLLEALKETGMQDAKLEYELQALQSQVEDMESAVADFERHVGQLESRMPSIDNCGQTAKVTGTSGAKSLGMICRLFWRNP